MQHRNKTATLGHHLRRELGIELIDSIDREWTMIKWKFVRLTVIRDANSAPKADTKEIGMAKLCDC